MPDAIPHDYDTDPERFRANMAAGARYTRSADVHALVAEYLAAARVQAILDLGCGEGRLIHPVRAHGLPIVAFDYSATMLQAIPNPRVRGDALYLPFRSGVFGAVTALWMLYHLHDPRTVLAECFRVLQPGGMLIACAPSRYNDPELAAILPDYGVPATFDAENGADLVGEYFTIMQIERWDAPFVDLPDTAALRLYLRGRGLSQTAIEQAMQHIGTPLSLTKRGMLIYAEKPPATAAHDPVLRAAP